MKVECSIEYNPLLDEDSILIRIPRGAVEPEMNYVEFDPGCGIRLEGPGIFTDEPVQLHPESLPVLLMKYAFRLAEQWWETAPEELDFKELAK